MLEKGCELWEPSFGRLKGPKDGVTTTGGREAGARQTRCFLQLREQEERAMHSPFSLSTLPHGREGAEEATSLTQFPSGGWGRQ